MYKIIVKKFGGEALKNIKNIRNICNIIKKNIISNKKVIMVVSAPKNFTNLLNNISIQNIYSNREKDVLLSCGEQISSSLISGILNSMGIKSISLQGWQVPIYCNKNEIIYVCKNKLTKIIKNYDVTVVSGFQGINKDGNIVTLKRGDSDTSAVFISSIFKSKCYFYKDTSGIFQTDPKIYKLKRIKKIFIEDLLEISSSGAKILSLNSVINIFKNNINTKILSFKNMKGTKIINKKKMNNFLVVKKEYLFKLNNKKIKLLKDIDIVKITKNNTYFFCTKNLKFKNKIIYKFTIIGIKVKIKIINILYKIKKYIYKNIINSMENKFSFLIKKKYKKKTIKKIISIFN